MPNPTIPTELAEIIALHKSLFGGFTMTATPPEPDPKQPDGTKPDDGGKDVFVHISAVERAGLYELREGQALSYEIVADRKTGKSAAANLRAEG